jgi:photosystem II stability/assembly factor-like uncharacterized protein
VNSDIVYAGTDVPPPLTINRAQVFKTSDGGRHWEESWMSATSGVIVQTIQALIVDPKNSSTIYAGTLNPDRMGFSNQAGVFKSKDGGQTWLGLQGIWGPDHRSIRSLALDPINPANLYATSAYGEFWRSVNGGDIATSTYLNTHGSLMLAIDPASPATLYAGDGAGKNIFKSTDAGFTWRSLTIN